MFCLSLLARTETLVAVSAISTFSLMPRGSWDQPHGGLNQLGGIRGGEFLEISGWAFRCGDAVESVTVVVNGVPCGAVQTGIPVTHVADSLPDFDEAAACGFSVTLHASAFSKLGPLLHAFATVRFRSGSELALSSGSITWVGARELESGCATEIESIHSDGGGNVLVSGWAVPAEPLIGPGFSAPRVFVETRHRWIELADSPSGLPGTIAWSDREDLDGRFPAGMQRLPYGFRAVISPIDVDHSAGTLQLWIGGEVRSSERGRNGEAWHRIGLECDAQKLTALVEAHLQSPDDVRTALRGAKSAAKRSLGLTARPQLPLPSGVQHRGLKKALFVSHNLRATEGAPKVLYTVAAELLARGGVHVHVISGENGELKELYERIGATVTVIDQFHVAAESWKSFRNGYRRAFAAAAEFDPDIVYANGTDAFWGVCIAEELGVPSLLGIHESKSPLSWQPQLDTRYRMRFLHALKKVSRFVFVSEATKKLFELPGAKRPASVIPNGVAVEELVEYAAAHTKENLHKVLQIAPETAVVSIVGTTTWRKGQDVFLRAMHALTKLRPETQFQFLIVGARALPYLKELKALCRDLALEDRVAFIDEQPDVRNYFAVSDVLCICSREESAPLVSLEALAIGVPIVSTDVFGLKEQLTAGSDAIIVAVDDPQALAAAVANLIDSPATARRLIDNGRNTVRKRFALPDCTSQHIAVLERTCG